MLRKNEKNKTSRKKLVGILVAIVMLGTMVASAASSTSTPTVVGSGTIITVTWSPSPIQGMSIPSGTGATISLFAPGKLQILYNGNPIVVGNDGIPTIIIPTIKASFDGNFILPTPITIPYNAVVTKGTVANQWQLVLSFPTTYPGYSVTLGINGPLSISP
jgi:hypothetical protein